MKFYGGGKRSRDSFVRGRFALYLLALATALTIYTVYRNHVYRALFHGSYPVHGEVSGMTINVGAAQTSLRGLRISPVKVAVPMGSTVRGCEFLYGAAEYVFAEISEMEEGRWNYSLGKPRYLFKFRYDYKNKRCESKDLWINPGDLPLRISLQLVDVHVQETEVVERAWQKGAEIRFSSAGNSPLQIVSVNFSGGGLRPQELRTQRVSFFSAELEPHQKRLIVAPYDSLQSEVLGVLEQAITDCKNGDCHPVRGAVALVLDSQILGKLDEAMAVGVPLDIVTNHQPRMIRNSALRYGGYRELNFSPWMWLRGNPHFDRVGILPMHTKFLTYKDTVLTSSSNYEFDRWYKSRDFAMKYSSQEIADIFLQIHLFIRTSVYFPLRVDRRHNAVILFNAERSRGYSASTNKPYVAIETETGVRSTAYGVLFETLRTTAGKLWLNMSPLANSCQRYGVKLCFFSILKEKATTDGLDLLLNYYFYRPRDEVEYVHETEAGVALELRATAKKLLSMVKGTASKVSLMSLAEYSESSHHARSGIVGDELALLGSANYATLSSINTIEVLRDNSVVRAMKEDWDTYDEPYFIVRRSKYSDEHQSFADCEFIAETDLLTNAQTQKKMFSRTALLKELQRVSGKAIKQPYRVMYRFTPQHWIDKDSVHVSDFYEDEDWVPESFSSYFCLGDPVTKQTYVVKVPSTDKKYENNTGSSRQQ